MTGSPPSVVRPASRDSGSMSVLVAAALASVVTIAVALWSVAAVTAHRHRVASAADMAALAGATAAVRGMDACEAARTTAIRQGMDEVTCRLLPDDSVVVVIGTPTSSIRLPRIIDLGPDVTGSARAGPVALLGSPSP